MEKLSTHIYEICYKDKTNYTDRLALLPPVAFYDQLDSNRDSDSKQLDSDSRKKGWIQIQLDSDLKCMDSDPDSDSRYLDSHITDRNALNMRYKRVAV